MFDRDRLSTLIEEALRDADDITLPIAFKDWRETLAAQPPPESVLHLIEHFERPEYDFAHDTMFNVGMGAFRTSPYLLTKWALTRAGSVGIVQAVQEIESYLPTDHNAAYQVTAVKGLSTSTRYALTDDTELTPIDEVPESPEKATLRSTDNDIRTLFSLNRGFEFIHRALTEAPESALVSRVAIRPKYQYPEDERTPLQSSPVPDHRTILSIGTLLCSQNAPVGLREWTALLPEVPLAGVMPHGHRHRLQQVLPTGPAEELTISQLDSWRELLRNFGLLTDKQKRRIRVACDRLSQCINRVDDVQKAIDLGISLESVLLPADARDQLSYQFRIVGAWLTADTVADREYNYYLLKTTYDMRSEAVHNGTLTNKTRKVAGTNNLSNREAICAGTELAKRALKRIIHRRGLTDEDTRKLILGGLHGFS